MAIAVPVLEGLSGFSRIYSVYPLMKFGGVFDSGIIVSWRAKQMGSNLEISCCNSGILNLIPRRFHCNARQACDWDLGENWLFTRFVVLAIVGT